MLLAVPDMKVIGAGAMAREAGHTLIELATVVAVIAVATALAYPSLAGMRRGQELEAAAVGTAQALRLAHWRAVVTGRRVQVAPRRAPDGSWRICAAREESAGVWVAEGEERRVPTNVVVAVAGPAEKTFNPDGTCSIGSITLRGDGGVYRCTLAAATGRVRLYRGDREVGRGR